MKKKEFEDFKKTVRKIKDFEVKLPKSADSIYFANLEDKIMKKVNGICEEVRESLVDFCEENVTSEKAEEIKLHIKICPECMNEYKLTKSLIKDGTKVTTERTEEYFEELPKKITNRIFGKTKSICEIAQDHIVNKYTGDSIPLKIKRHLTSCSDCRIAVVETRKIVNNLKVLSVPMPSEKFFETQLQKIDNAIELLPSHRIAKSEQHNILNYFTTVVETFRTVFIQPYSAIAASVMVALLIIGGRFYYSHDRIEEQQINLSEVLNKTNAVSPIIKSVPKTTTASKDMYITDEVTDPIEDAKLDLKATGTAEVKIKRKEETRTKKSNRKIE